MFNLSPTTFIIEWCVADQCLNVNLILTIQQKSEIFSYETIEGVSRYYIMNSETKLLQYRSVSVSMMQTCT